MTSAKQFTIHIQKSYKQFNSNIQQFINLKRLIYKDIIVRYKKH